MLLMPIAKHKKFGYNKHGAIPHKKKGSLRLNLGNGRDRTAIPPLTGDKAFGR